MADNVVRDNLNTNLFILEYKKEYPAHILTVFRLLCQRIQTSEKYLQTTYLKQEPVDRGERITKCIITTSVV